MKSTCISAIRKPSGKITAKTFSSIYPNTKPFATFLTIFIINRLLKTVLTAITNLSMNPKTVIVRSHLIFYSIFSVNSTNWDWITYSYYISVRSKFYRFCASFLLRITPAKAPLSNGSKRFSPTTAPSSGMPN